MRPPISAFGPLSPRVQASGPNRGGARTADMLAVARDSRNFEYMGRIHDLEDQLAAVGRASKRYGDGCAP
jgi:hypothetical protein